MEKGSQVQSKILIPEHYKDEDEIELIDVFRVLWKWKYLILAGTIACGLIAAIISNNMKKIFSIDMVLKPGILKERSKVYIDSPEKIKALIDSGAFNNDILNYINGTKKDRGSRKLNFKVTIQKGSGTLYVKYETANVKQGMIILDRLSKLLLEEYSKGVKYFKNKYDLNWSLIKNEIENIESSIQSNKRNVENIEKRNNELISEVELIKNNNRNLITEKMN